jgi:hypothetical protein
MFKYQSETFVNIRNKKLVSVKDFKDEEAQPIWAIDNKGNAGQRWRVVYVDNMGDQAYDKKGQRDNEFGFLALEVFYLRSRLPMQRVVECVGANNAVIKKWYKNRKAQQWRFDPVSKTVRNMNWTSYVFSQEGANLRCRSMTSRWF